MINPIRIGSVGILVALLTGAETKGDCRPGRAILLGFGANVNAQVTDFSHATCGQSICQDNQSLDAPGSVTAQIINQGGPGSATATLTFNVTSAGGGVQRFDISGSATAQPNARAGVFVFDVTLQAVDGPVRMTFTYNTRRVLDGVVFDAMNTTQTQDIPQGGSLGTTVRWDAIAGTVASTSSNNSLTIVTEPLPVETQDTFHWTNAAGGSYSVAGNWDPACIPVHDGVRSDTAIFDLNTGSAIPINASGATATAGRWEILNGAIEFSGDATLSGGSSLPPSLAVGFGGRLSYDSGFLTTQHSVIGNGPPQSRVTLNTNTNWFNLGNLRVGANGGAGGIDLGEIAFLSVNGSTEVGSGSDGELMVHSGAVAQFQSGLSIGSVRGGGGIVTVSGTGQGRRSRLSVTGFTGVGNPLAPSGSPGFLTVTGGAEMELNGNLGVSQWVAGANSAAVTIEGILPTATATVHGTILLGELGPGDMIIQSGGTVDCTELTLGSLIPGADGDLTLVGLASGMTVAQNVQVGGDSGHGIIRVDDNSFLNVHGNMTVGNVGGGEVFINARSFADIGNGLFIGSFAGGSGSVTVQGINSSLHVTGLTSVGIGPALSAGFLAVNDEAQVTIDGNLHVDHLVPGANAEAVTIQGLNSLVDVHGSIFLGVFGEADMLIKDGGEVDCTELAVGSGINGVVSVLRLVGLASGMIVDQNVQVGGNTQHGIIDIDTVSFLNVGGTMTVGSPGGGRVTVNGHISGAGLVVAVPNGVIDGTGQISAIKVVNGGTIAPGLSPGTLTIDGDYEQLPTGVLVIEYAGLNPGEFDVLHVTGQTTLGGRLEVHFRGGFSPDDPAAFIHSQSFVEADQGITGDYDQRIYAFPDLFADFDDDGDKDL
ncbi:MAG: hypothetical protein Q7R41_06090, partial [Phycisphaerales bacterium]|nr:hypothetical protein [Phycisphaerales bacterium]